MIKVLMVLLLACSGRVFAEASAFVTQVTGGVKIVKSGAELPAFSRVSAGDRLRVEADGKLRLVYAASGRQETWIGACAIEVREREGIGARCAPAAAKELSPAVVSVILRAPQAMFSVEGRVSVGAVRIKTAPNMNAIRDMMSGYEALRTQAEPDDITPELWLLGRQQELDLTDEASETLLRIREGRF